MKNLIALLIVPLMFIGCEENSSIGGGVGGGKKTQLRYTADSENLIAFDSDAFDAEIVSHTYEQGIGVITFDKPITKVSGPSFESHLLSITIPTTVEDVSGFFCCERLETVELGVSVKTIAAAFEDCECLHTVYCAATTPPLLDERSFTGCDENLKVYVPHEHLWRYQSNTEWGYYFNLEGYDF